MVRYRGCQAFYRAIGLAPMHEFNTLDWDGPTLIMIKILASPPAIQASSLQV
ncbi:MAG: hypothetical protein LH471_07175 [Salinibacterium sp.]|nr:hypothetical protein [Salinibacterium sp.]